MSFCVLCVLLRQGLISSELAATATTMLETEGKRLAVKRDVVTLSFRPFEIKTVRLTPAGGA